MATQLSRANADGSVNAAGNFARAVVLVNVADILAAVGISNAEKRSQALQRLLAELAAAVTFDAQPDAAIDQQATDAAARAAAAKLARPSGSL